MVAEAGEETPNKLGAEFGCANPPQNNDDPDVGLANNEADEAGYWKFPNNEADEDAAKNDAELAGLVNVEPNNPPADD